MLRYIRAALIAAALTCPAMSFAASTINSLPTATFPLSDSGCAASSTQNVWITNGATADYRITPQQLGYIYEAATPPSCPFRYQQWWNTGVSPPQLQVYTGSIWVAMGWLDYINGYWIPATGGPSFFGNSGNPQSLTGVTTYIGSGGCNASNGLACGIPVTHAGHITSLTCAISTAAGNTTCTLYLDNAQTGMACTITSPATRCTDTGGAGGSHVFPAAAGTLLSLRVVGDGTAPGAAQVTWGAGFGY
jgi:hypothetical protein